MSETVAPSSAVSGTSRHSAGFPGKRDIPAQPCEAALGKVQIMVCGRANVHSSKVIVSKFFVFFSQLIFVQI